MLYETLYKLETEKFQLQDEVQLLKAEKKVWRKEWPLVMFQLIPPELK